MIAALETLKELIGMGFSPMVALIVIGLMVLWAALCGVVVFMWRSTVREHKDRDALRDAWKAEVDGRLKVSEFKNDECDKDRDRLHEQIQDLRNRVGRFEKCSSGEKCPMKIH
jgi:hypothetical protein